MDNNSEGKFPIQRGQSGMSLVKICSLNYAVYCRMSINLFPYFINISEFDKFWYTRFGSSEVEREWFFVKFGYLEISALWNDVSEIILVEQNSVAEILMQFNPSWVVYVEESFT